MDRVAEWKLGQGDSEVEVIWERSDVPPGVWSQLIEYVMATKIL